MPVGRRLHVNTAVEDQAAQRAHRRLYAATALSAADALFALPAFYAATAGGELHVASVHLVSSACITSDADNALHADHRSAASTTSNGGTALSVRLQHSARMDESVHNALCVDHQFNASTKYDASTVPFVHRIVLARMAGCDQVAPSALQASYVSTVFGLYGARSVTHRTYVNMVARAEIAQNAGLRVFANIVSISTSVVSATDAVSAPLRPVQQ